MSVVCTVMNMKGGVGKTTVCTNVGGFLAMYRTTRMVDGVSTKIGPYKVLLIDYDPQFNLSQAFLPAKKYFKLEKERKTTLSILMDDPTIENPFSLKVPGNFEPPKVDEVSTKIFDSWNKDGQLDLVPSTLDLMYVALGNTHNSLKPIRERFRKFIEEARKSYDIILIDCHPAGSIFTQTSLSVSDHVIIPVVPQKYSVRGIGLMMNFLTAKELGTNPPKPHILFNSMPRVGVSKEEAQIRSDSKYSAYCMENSLKKYKAFADPEDGKNFIWQNKNAYSGEALRNLSNVSREVMEKVTK